MILATQRVTNVKMKITLAWMRHSKSLSREDLFLCCLYHMLGFLGVQNYYDLTKLTECPVSCSSDVREHLRQCECHNPAFILGHHAVPLGHAAGKMGFSATCFHGIHCIAVQRNNLLLI